MDFENIDNGVWFFKVQHLWLQKTPEVQPNGLYFFHFLFPMGFKIPITCPT